VNKDEPCTDRCICQHECFPRIFPGFTSLGTCILNRLFLRIRRQQNTAVYHPGSGISVIIKPGTVPHLETILQIQ
jgi:hypothetical protein